MAIESHPINSSTTTSIGTENATDYSSTNSNLSFTSNTNIMNTTFPLSNSSFVSTTSTSNGTGNATDDPSNYSTTTVATYCSTPTGWSFIEFQNKLLENIQYSLYGILIVLLIFLVIRCLRRKGEWIKHAYFFIKRKKSKQFIIPAGGHAKCEFPFGRWKKFIRMFCHHFLLRHSAEQVYA